MRQSALQYFNKNYPNNWCLKLANRIASNSFSALPSFIDLGLLKSPPKLQADDVLNSKWLLELSSSPFFIPSMAHLGQGKIAQILKFCLHLLHSGRYFCRIGLPYFFPRHIQQWQWEIM